MLWNALADVVHADVACVHLASGRFDVALSILESCGAGLAVHQYHVRQLCIAQALGASMDLRILELTWLA